MHHWLGEITGRPHQQLDLELMLEVRSTSLQARAELLLVNDIAVKLQHSSASGNLRCMSTGELITLQPKLNV